MHIVEMKIQDYGVLTIEIDDSVAPKTAANFLKLVDDKFYDGLSFHRIIKGFMIQGGCPQGTGTGGPGYHIEGEFSSNGFNNPLKHEKGIISMARAMDPNSAGSQFFIMHEASPHLDGQYSAFGKVIEGLEIIDKIANVKTGFQDRPVEKIVIESVVRK